MRLLYEVGVGSAILLCIYLQIIGEKASSKSTLILILKTDITDTMVENLNEL